MKFQLPFEVMIGLRHLGARRRSFISLVSLLSAFGVAMGVMVLLVALSVLTGFQEVFTRKMLEVHSHMLVTKYGVDFYEYREVAAKLREIPGVKRARPVLLAEMVVAGPGGVSGVMVKGVEPEEAGRSPLAKAGEEDLGEMLRQRPGGLPPVILGVGLMERLQIKVGQVVRIISPTTSVDLLVDRPWGLIPSMKRFVVVGQYESGIYEFDSRTALMGLKDAQAFFAEGDIITALEVYLERPEGAKDVAWTVHRGALGYPYRVITWMHMNRALFSTLALQKAVITIILAFIVLVAATGIVGTVIMMASSKRAEIAILKAMGATRRSILTIFLIDGLGIGLAGTSAGLALGLMVCAFLGHWPYLLDRTIYMIDSLPVAVHGFNALITALVAIAICLIASVLPALSAARLHPVEGLRG